MTLLYQLIAELRAELAGEVPIVLHTTHVPRLTNPDGETDRANADEGGLGLPFTAAMHRRLSHRDWFGINELAAKSLAEVGDFCRSRHQSDLHRSPGRATSLCERIVSALAEFDQPLGQVAWREGLDPELVESLALKALRHAYVWRHRELHRHMSKAKENERDMRVICPACDGATIQMRRRAA